MDLMMQKLYDDNKALLEREVRAKAEVENLVREIEAQKIERVKEVELLEREVEVQKREVEAQKKELEVQKIERAKEVESLKTERAREVELQKTRANEVELMKREVELLKSGHEKEVEALKRELDTLRLIPASVQEAVQLSLKEERESLARQASQAKFLKDQRTIWLRSP